MKCTVEFENTKNRGDVQQSVTFQFEKIEGAGYQALLDSVTRVSEKDRDDTRKKSDREKQLKADKRIIDSIRKLIRKSNLGKTELEKHVREQTAEPRRKIIKVIDDWTGRKSEGGLWHIEKKGKNEHIYKWNELT